MAADGCYGGYTSPRVHQCQTAAKRQRTDSPIEKRCAAFNQFFGLLVDWESCRKESALKQDPISQGKGSPAVLADDPNPQNGSAFYNAVMIVHHYSADSVERRFQSHEVQRGIANRFHRKFGDDRFLYITLRVKTASSDDLSHADLLRYLKPFPWLGRWWGLLAFKGKKRDRMQEDQPDAEQKYVFFATSPWDKERDEVVRVYPGLPDIWNAAQQHELAAASFPKCTADEARRALVPICAETKLLAESAAKYNKRLLLGFSSATGTIVCRADQIHEVADLRSHRGAVLTDGCGRIGTPLAERIRGYLGLSDIPAVFQIRFGPGKGLLNVDLGLVDQDGLYLSESMVKWFNDWTTCSEEDRRIEVVTWSRPCEQAALNTQIITVLESSGVPPQAFMHIQQTHISAMLEERLGGDVGSVASRLSCQDGAGIALQACDAGIDARQEPALLANIWRYSVEKALDDAKTNASYKSPGARRAFILPDFAQKLLPGEAVFKVSSKGYIAGDAIIARNPCTAPWDVQKVRLLSNVEVLERFRGYPTCLHDDVLLLSAHESCDFAPAHVLAGGDYDGDTVLILTDTSLVQHFKNSVYEHARVCEVHDTVKKLVPSVDCHSTGSESPFRSICKAAAEALKKDLVVGGLANRWHFLADELGARHESAIKAGLAHQLALDGGIDSRISMRQITTALELPDHQVPHWHRSATRGNVVYSRSVLGKLYTALDTDKLHDKYRLQYGNVSLYQAVLKPHAINFESFQIKVDVDDVLRAFMPHAQRILQGFRQKSQECRATRRWDDLDVFFQSELRGCSDPPLLAAAIYRQQCDDFLKSAADKNLRNYHQVELELEPAWRLCPRQLCEYVVKFVAKDPYPMSAAIRPKLRYKPAKRSDAP
ncbi:SHL2 [Symbiodinium sp. CCMP2456]|nr:SHL2 [Symbiodinium sp. CCMP2456]